MNRSSLRLFSFALSLPFVALLAGCDSNTAGSSDSKLRVVATTTMVADMVRDVAGDRAEVIALMGPGVDPHLYKPAATDVTKLSGASAIFYSGLMLEGRMADLFAKMSRQGKKVYAVTEVIGEDELLSPEEFEGHWDPHVWGDASLWARCIDVVVEGLTAEDPDGASYYESRAEEVRTKYLGLHEWAKMRVAELPESQRVLITSHDAFNYFGNAYGFEVVGVQGISTVTEAGLADMTKMVDFIKERGVKAIFVESSVSPATIQRISQDAGVKIGGELFSDALGAPGHTRTVNGETYDEGTYEGFIKHNINTAVEALK